MSEKSDNSIKIEIDQNDDHKIKTVNTIESHNDNDELTHNGKSITIMRVSPNEKYLVTYYQDDESIVGWNVEGVDEGQLEPEFSFKIINSHHEEKVRQVCISDNKELAYIVYTVGGVSIYNMNIDGGQRILLDVDHFSPNDGIFNSKNELILSGFFVYFPNNEFILICSKQIKNNKWKVTRMYKIPKGFDLISMSKYDKFFFYLNNSIYVWDLLTEKSTKIFASKEVEYDKYDNNNKYFNRAIAISSYQEYIFLKFKDKIIIYSIELEAPLSLNDIQLNDFTCRIGLVHSLLHESVIKNFMIHYWNECLNRLKENGKLSKEYQTKSLPTHPDYLCTTTKYAFGALNGHIWKINLEDEIKKMNFTLKNFDKIIEDCKGEDSEDWYFDNDFKINKEKYGYKHLNINLVDPYVDTIRALFQEVISDYTREDTERELTQNLIKLKIKIIENTHEIELQVFKKFNDNSDWKLICKTPKSIGFSDKIYLCGIKLYDNDIIILTTQALLIYHFNDNIKSLSLIYYYAMDLNFKEKRIEKLQEYENVFSKSTLPSPTVRYDLLTESKEYWLKCAVDLLLTTIENSTSSDTDLNSVCKLCIDYDDKEMLLKYVVELYKFVIEEPKKNRKYWFQSKIPIIKPSILLICDIYKRCIDYTDEEFLLKYGVEILKIVIEERKLELIDGIYKKCIKYFREDPDNNRMFLSIIVFIMPLLNEYYPEFISRYSLETTMIIDFHFYSIEHQNNNLHLCSLQYPKLINFSKIALSKSKLKYGCIINTKYFWNNYFIIFFILIIIVILPFFYIPPIILLVIYIYKHFKTTTITIPTIVFMIPYIKFVNYPKNYNWYLELIKPQPSLFVKMMSRDIYKTWDGEALINFKWNAYGKYYYAMIWIGFMILLGCFTTSATIPKQYISEDVQRQLLIASIILGFIHLSYEVRQMIYDFNKWIQDFWNIFDIIAFSLPIVTSIYWLQTRDMNVQLLSFTCLFLDIKFLLFFRAFESFVNTYNQVFNNGTMDSFFVQNPDGNTNMFVDFRTALFGMYLFLTGDSSALSNWPYIKNPSLSILFVLFSLLIVVYLMNLFIGLLNMAIDKDNDRVSYLMLKAEILAEIELFYLLPHQRRWPTWFPDEIYYYADADKTRKKIKEMMDNSEWNTDGLPEMKQNLLDQLGIRHTKHDPVDEITLRKILEEMREV
ncbi:hypothetical protein GLOIN_2v1874127 [Rhizophagus clarus]|uniref:Ion transport domain-containing protein n=1 Tax=Rhizophagus clarus TaxID=94130 RepID=A0A8H3KSK4_9GLOM|nr:hypothetical protein GLOIN_2v1874127 [Rhizophagus clarus]